MRGGFTLAVVGHNEAERLHYALGQALEAAGPEDCVWFVDSGSTDGSADRAAALGAEVVTAPIGKGRAIATALDRCRTEYIVFVDGDMERSDCNMHAALCDAVVATGADMVVGAFEEKLRRRSVTPGVYWPLVEALFPEVHAVEIVVPLSGLRAIRADFPVGRIPPAYGVETHLNLRATLEHGRVANCELGMFFGPVRGYTNLVPCAIDVTHAILDEAEMRDRIDAVQRAAWQAWADCVIDVMRRQPTSPAEEPAYFARLDEAIAHPFPPR